MVFENSHKHSYNIDGMSQTFLRGSTRLTEGNTGQEQYQIPYNTLMAERD